MRLSRAAHAPGNHGSAGQPDRVELHELRRSYGRAELLDAGRGRGAAVLPPGGRAGSYVLGHRERVPRCSGGCTAGPPVRVCPGPRSSSSATRRCDGWAPTGSTCASSTGSMTRCRWRDHGRPARARAGREGATSARRRCGPGSWPSCRPPPWSKGGRRSPPCKTSTTGSSARRSGKCCRCAPTWASACSPTPRKGRAG
jgi:hypothetical protein